MQGQEVTRSISEEIQLREELRTQERLNGFKENFLTFLDRDDKGPKGFRTIKGTTVNSVNPKIKGEFPFTLTEKTTQESGIELTTLELTLRYPGGPNRRYVFGEGVTRAYDDVITSTGDVVSIFQTPTVDDAEQVMDAYCDLVHGKKGLPPFQLVYKRAA